MQTPTILLKVLGTILLAAITHLAISQENKGAEKTYTFGGAVTITNNGISLLPTFSLGKPAGILDMKVGKRLTFEPQFRFSLEGKPWSMIFWWRYKVVDRKKFNLRVGAHPAMLFRTVPVTTYGVTTETIETLRYLALEVVPNYNITDNFSIGMYYLKGHGLQDNSVKNSDFITINANFSHIKLVNQLYLKLYPQFYYLKMDDQDGIYFTATMTLAKERFPISIESIINQPIDTGITGGDDFTWNISLIYSFSNIYKKQ